MSIPDACEFESFLLPVIFEEQDFKEEIGKFLICNQTEYRLKKELPI